MTRSCPSRSSETESQRVQAGRPGFGLLTHPRSPGTFAQRLALSEPQLSLPVPSPSPLSFPPHLVASSLQAEASGFWAHEVSPF